MNNKHVKQYIIQNISHTEDSLFLRQIYTLVKLYLERKDRKHTGKAAQYEVENYWDWIFWELLSFNNKY